MNIIKCACGERMALVGDVRKLAKPRRPDAPVVACWNCNHVQVAECGPKAVARVRTQQDKDFDAEMYRRMSSWYPGIDAPEVKH